MDEECVYEMIFYQLDLFKVLSGPKWVWKEMAKCKKNTKNYISVEW